MPDNDELVEVEIEKVQWLVLKANIELLQRVNKLIDMMEKYGEENCD